MRFVAALTLTLALAAGFTITGCSSKEKAEEPPVAVPDSAPQEKPPSEPAAKADTTPQQPTPPQPEPKGSLLGDHPEASAQAVELLDRYFSHLVHEEYDAAYALLSEDFRRKLGYGEYLAILRDFSVPEKYLYRQILPGRAADELWVEVDVGMSDGVQRPYRYTVSRAADGNLSIRWFTQMKPYFDYPAERTKGH